MKKVLDLIYSGLDEKEKQNFSYKSILITGYKGFIGSVMSDFFISFKEDLKINKIFLLDISNQVDKDSKNQNDFIACNNVFYHKFNVITDYYNEIPHLNEVDFVFHLASIASPTFYRRFPLETMDANVVGLRRLLDFFRKKNVKFLHFSSSEVYGNPSADCIPTKEDYNGNVPMIGPRSCYDESKRYSETICFYYNQLYSKDITIVRPFNNYGPGMNINDKRAPADFAFSILNNTDIKIMSDGTPTRSYLFISDAIVGYLKAILFNGFEIFNIGNDSEEISISDYASIFVEIGKRSFNYNSEVQFDTSNDLNYLTHNPLRRMPDISKARKLLGFSPTVDLSSGIAYYLDWVFKEEKQ
jgi:UDP-glucuronate decarboxylase